MCCQDVNKRPLIAMCLLHIFDLLTPNGHGIIHRFEQGIMKYVKIALLLMALVLSSYVLIVSSFFSLGSEEAHIATMQDWPWGYVLSRVLVNFITSMIMAFVFIFLRKIILLFTEEEGSIIDKYSMMYFCILVVVGVIAPISSFFK